ncbi:uncharacterized protein LOC129739354 isoform X2 [Uranotaenia lowii]|uniref:uncharacterized protein LOC129739354 isoform X2 n=1 Tax=Uranotaenia lowii TaxID=190385 RepID=UPI002479450C|nr:uncharacterized protein LOC129739354 isoform X2 [Uranotaenia lowii]
MVEYLKKISGLSSCHLEDSSELTTEMELQQRSVPVHHNHGTDQFCQKRRQHHCIQQHNNNLYLTKAIMRRLKKTHKRVETRRMASIFFLLYDSVAVLLCVFSVVQSRPAPSSAYWYNPCHHNVNNQLPSYSGYNFTNQDMSRMKDQLNTSYLTVGESVKNFTEHLFGAKSVRRFMDDWWTMGMKHVQWLHLGLGDPKQYANDTYEKIYVELNPKELIEVHKEFYDLMKISFRRYVRIAKAIDQMKLDMLQTRASYPNNDQSLLDNVREEVRRHVKQVLCEIYECILKIDHDFVQQILEENEMLEIKSDYSDESHRLLRDGFIYGDLLVNLDHILQFIRAYEVITARK